MAANGDAEKQNALYRAMNRLPKWTTLPLGAIAVGALATLDIATGPEIGISVLYLAPVLYVAWAASTRWGVIIALVAAITWGVVDTSYGAGYSSAWIPVWNSSVRLGFFLVSVTLLNSVKGANAQLRELALTDPLTGLANTRAFCRDLEREIQRQQRHGSPFVLAYIDLDRFKEVNDTHGHSAGDRLLREVATRMVGALRESDIVARLGGDEFGILMPETGAQAASVAISRIQSAGAGLLRTAPDGVPDVGLTLGAAVFEAPPKNADAAVKVADEVMYEVKQTQRGTSRIVIVGKSGRSEYPHDGATTFGDPPSSCEA